MRILVELQVVCLFRDYTESENEMVNDLGLISLSLSFVTECGTLFSTKLSSFLKKVYRALWQTFISQEASFTRHNSQLKPIDLSVMAVTLRFVSISQPRRASFLDTLLLPVPALLQKIRTHPADAPVGPSAHHPRKSPRFIPGGPPRRRELGRATNSTLPAPRTAALRSGRNRTRRARA